MAHVPPDPHPTPPGQPETGATIVAPYDELLGEHAHEPAPPTVPPYAYEPLVPSETAPYRPRRPAWVYVALGFVGALTGAGLLITLAIGIGAIVYYAP